MIRSATEDADLATIQRLAQTIWREHYPGIISLEQIEYMLERRYSLEALRADRNERGIVYDLALQESEPVGYSAYGPQSEDPEPKLFSLYVRADQRGRGCGTALLARAERWARDRGATSIVLTVNKRNDSAIRAYERFGFRRRGPVVTDIGGGFVMDDYLMERGL